MRLFLLTSVAMVAFAANSLLNRMALVGPGLDAVLFGSIRLAAGAVVLVALVAALGGAGRLRQSVSLPAALFLLVYIYGFSLAYEAIGAGVGALILFGWVQVTMFAGGLVAGERPPVLRWTGAALAFGGLVWLLWPGRGVELSLPHGAAMAAAGIGWGLYSLAGRGASDPLRATAANFAIAAMAGLVIAVLGSDPAGALSDPRGIWLAVLSGALTSGLGYALWYRVLPNLAPSVAAVAQLTVPVIAMAGGAILLSEPLGGEFILPAAVVLGGVGISALALRK